MAENSATNFNSKSWTYSPTSCSPLTNLALNLEDLSTGLDATPKRRMSFSSNISSSPGSAQLLLALKNDDGFCDSPTPMSDSPVFLPNRSLKDSNFEKNTSSLSRSRFLFHRLHSAPSSSPVLTKLDQIPRSRSLWSSPTKSVSKTSISPSESTSSSVPSDALKCLEDPDLNSGDSGFSDREECFQHPYQMKFTFTEPKGIPPRRLKNQSDPATSIVTALQMPSLISASNSGVGEDAEVTDENVDPTDAGFLEQLDDDFDAHSSSTIDSSSFPTGFTSLMDSKVTPAFQNRVAGQSNNKPLSPPSGPLTFSHNIDTPKGKSCMRGLFNQKGDKDNTKRTTLPFKRQEVPRDVLSPIQNKRRKSVSLCSSNYPNRMVDTNIIPKKVTLQRHFSENEATIKKAVAMSVENHDLIGDMSKIYVLPRIDGKRSELQCISPKTVERLINGDFCDELEFLIVDCRFPYEYDGGHIKGAVNIYTRDDILQQLLAKPVQSSKRLVLVFHCEFSSERGPNMSKYLRDMDRRANKDCYPQLHYPEMYLLEGGYKAFFENHMMMCDPQAYVPMSHKDHEEELRFFRAKSKSFTGDKSHRFGRHHQRT